MSMKLHVVAASDIINKGLDLSFPHSELGEDGLLVPPPLVEKAVPAIVVSAPEVIQEPVDVPAPVNRSEPVEVPELVDQSDPEPQGLDVPVVEEEKKTGRKAKKS